jgi:hypothetical protein
MLTHILCLVSNSVVCVCIAQSLIEVFGINNSFIILSLTCTSCWLFVDNVVIYSDLLLLKKAESASHLEFESHESIRRQLLSMLSYYNALERENDDLRQKLRSEFRRSQPKRVRSTSF